MSTELPVVAFATFRDGVLTAAWDGATRPPPVTFRWTHLLCDHSAATARIAELEETQRKFGALQHELMNRAESAERDADAEIERLRAVVDQHRPLADVAQRLDASISWLRDGKKIDVGIGLADMIALRALLRSMEDHALIGER